MTPPERSCLQESMYGVVMDFSGGFVKFLHAENCLAVGCFFFSIKCLVFPTSSNSDPIELDRNCYAFTGVTNFQYLQYAIDFRMGKFGRRCSQVRKLNTTLTFGKFFGFVTFRGQICPSFIWAKMWCWWCEIVQLNKVGNKNLHNIK